MADEIKIVPKPEHEDTSVFELVEKIRQEVYDKIKRQQLHRDN